MKNPQGVRPSRFARERRKERSDWRWGMRSMSLQDLGSAQPIPLFSVKISGPILFWYGAKFPLFGIPSGFELYRVRGSEAFLFRDRDLARGACYWLLLQNVRF
jgi:hypothetical protein